MSSRKSNSAFWIVISLVLWFGTGRLPAQVLEADSAAATEASAPPTHYMGREIARTMHYTGAPWLVRESREREEECSKLLESLAVQPGQTVCDIGCGNGFYTLRLAGRVGPRGTVYAVDIQPEMLELLAERAHARAVPNIRPVLGSAIDPQLPVGEIDLLLAVDVYHEFSHPEEMLAELRASLAPRGRLALVEFRLEDPDVPIKRLHKLSQRQMMRELTANGLKLVGQFDDLPWQHVLFFARDDSPLEAVPLSPWQAPPAGEAAESQNLAPASLPSDRP